MDTNYFRYATERMIFTGRDLDSKIGIAVVCGKKSELFSSYANHLDYDPVEDAIKFINRKFKNSKSEMYVVGDVGKATIDRIDSLENVECYILGNNDVELRDNIHIVKRDKNSSPSSNKWWTEEFYDKAYDIVKDRKFPVTIPGYNRPALPTLNNLRVHMFTDECNWDFFVIVRESQREMYEEATKKYKYVTIKAFPDEVINNAGAVRRTTQKWLKSMGVKATFQMDDDVQYLGYSRNGYKLDGEPKATYRSMKRDPFEVPRVLAMWQLAMEKEMKDNNVLISCGQQIAFSWKMDYCESMKSSRIMRGPMTQVVCFNIDGLTDLGIYHNNNKDVGFDDIDFTLRVIENGGTTCCFPWLVYGCEALGGGNGDTVSEERLKARFKENQEKLKAIHNSKYYVNFRDKRDLAQVCIDWRKARMYHAEKVGLSDPKDYRDFTEYDIWKNGELLKG